jgi:hypothetical protein
VKATRWVVGPVFGLAVCGALLVCLPACLPQPDPNAVFLEALMDANTPVEQWELERNLTAIVAGQRGLEWDGTSGESRVKLVTWTSYTGYDNLPPDAPFTLTREVWVVPPYELKGFLRHAFILPSQKILRMEQLLGLRPNSGKTRFVEFWADPNDVFRPAPDPEITDHEAEPNFPVSSQFIAVDPNFVLWFDNLMAISYLPATGLPWTRMGYTYDWGNPRPPHEGLSEFVIRNGATIGVHSVTLNEDYLR